jgi:hypothetical protein
VPGGNVKSVVRLRSVDTDNSLLVDRSR